MNRKYTLALAMAMGAIAGQAAGNPEIEKLQALDKKCEAARAAKLKPLRAAMVEKCVNEEKRPRSVCEVEMSTYGEGGSSAATGAAVNRRFYDLPECVAARNAWVERDRRSTR